MTLFLTIVHVIVCFVLILVILLQAGRGQGLNSASFGGGNVQSLFGTRAADFLTKATTAAAILFLLTCIGLDFMEVRKSRSLMDVGSKSAPIDVEQLKKALEKVQAEAEMPAVDPVLSEEVEVVENQAEETLQGVSEKTETNPVDAKQ